MLRSGDEHLIAQTGGIVLKILEEAYRLTTTGVAAMRTGVTRPPDILSTIPRIGIIGPLASASGNATTGLCIARELEAAVGWMWSTQQRRHSCASHGRPMERGYWTSCV
jgi:hypothetical protein